MTDRRYKGYTIRVVGLSHHIFRPGVPVPELAAERYAAGAAGYAQSFAEAKRWINYDIDPSVDGTPAYADPTPVDRVHDYLI